jgi:hypothetical protein
MFNKSCQICTFDCGSLTLWKPQMGATSWLHTIAYIYSHMWWRQPDFALPCFFNLEFLSLYKPQMGAASKFHSSLKGCLHLQQKLMILFLFKICKNPGLASLQSIEQTTLSTFRLKQCKGLHSIDCHFWTLNRKIWRVHAP